MSGRPARVRERELNRAMKVARKAGAKELRVHLGDHVSIVIPLVPDDDKPIESEQQITL
jgi:protein involved in polysaccharide export with SLBB domain